MQATQQARVGSLQPIADSAMAISSLPMPDDMDADYSPQFVNLARALRAKITSGELADSTPLPACDVAAQYRVSVRVTYAALDMLAANHYLTGLPRTRHHRVNARTTP